MESVVIFVLFALICEEDKPFFFVLISYSITPDQISQVFEPLLKGLFVIHNNPDDLNNEYIMKRLICIFACALSVSLLFSLSS
jgi:hypothetical protein